MIDPRTKPSPVIADLSAVGGKAAHLLALRDLGAPVPPFLVWPVAQWRNFVAHAMARREVPSPTLPGDLDDASAEARRQALLTVPFPPELQADLQRVWAHFGGRPLCVRSSGTFEDLADLSFAGLYDSVLDVRTAADLERAVRTCWASVYGPRVRQYCRHHGLPLAKAGLAIIFQEFVAGQQAGVAFTVNPVTGRQNHLLLEYCEGTGDKLVSGQVTPHKAVWDHKAGRLLEGRLPPGFPASALALFRRIHREFGQPQDIEWVLAGGQVWVVQTRPITRITVEPSFGCWTTADFRDGGVSSSVVTPMMWSLYRYIWQFSMPRYFEIIKILEPERKTGVSWGECLFGRPYWNLGEVVRPLLKIPGFDEGNFFSDLGIQTVPDYRFRRVPTTLANVIGIVPTVLALERYYAYRIRKNREFRQAFPELIRPFAKTALSTLSTPELARRFRHLITHVYFKTESAYFFTIYNTSNAKLDFKIWLDTLNGRGNDISYIKLISGLLRMKHLAPMKALADLARRLRREPELAELVLRTPAGEIDRALAGHPRGDWLAAEMRSFLARYGYHSPRELDISCPRWEEDPQPVWRLLKTYLREGDPAESAVAHEKRQHALYRAEVDRARSCYETSWHRWLPFERWFFFRTLLRTRKYCWWREEMRDYSSRVYALIRRYLVEAERRLGLEPGAIWWLTWEEVLGGLEGTLSADELARRLAAAIEEAEMYRLFANPDELGTGFLSPAEKKTPGRVGTRWQGLGCSPGVIEGSVRVLRSIEEVDTLQRGEILVTPFTDPGWTPAFHLLGGVVTETGGILSHAAVISREYGIPAVLNLPGASGRLRTGQRVRLDGSAGTVELLGEG
ncbi:MAG: Phosphoenolpyruvate synthase [Candidatus Ozemobacter sibiricus]|uniref:Phosphoenolpyruvate synthase n=1 Tax=Candidatus Ozemobacter sibiricus TaxID=2268124 RepID=A0A367ZCZ5_9BACT|nr:MAG: Phosphoenolpyruvate synthase [Candidatus Ozemobacter sibiricus]